MASSDSDDMLVKRIKSGNREAFLLLYERYLDKVYRRVKSRIPESDVEDVTQEVFITVMNALGKFEQRSKFSTWLFTIVSRKIADFYRKRQSKDRYTFVPLFDTENAAASTVNQSEIDNKIVLQQSLQSLPEHYQEIILMRFADGLSFAEIAEQRTQSLDAAKSLYRRALQALTIKMNSGDD